MTNTPSRLAILGISAFYHDAAAAIVVNGEIVAAAQEERFTRKKHDAGFPENAIRYCLQEAGLSMELLHAVVFYDKPMLKFERLLETYSSFAPKGISSFVTSMPVWLKEKLFLKKMIYDELKAIGRYNEKNCPLLFPEHHLSHAASAYFPSPYTDAAILTIDGVGEWATASIAHGQQEKITVLKELHFPHSLGMLYSAFTYYLGFRVNSGEYKLMGLAPYGNPEAEETRRFAELITSQLVTVHDDGSIWLDQTYFRFATGLRMTHDDRWEQLFGVPRRLPESELLQVHCNMALAIQQVTEEVVLRMAKHAKELTNARNVCLAGGVALNCVANGKLAKAGIFENIYVQPAAGDAGGALGAALCGYYIHFEQQRTATLTYDAMKGAYLGPAIEENDIQQTIQTYHAEATAISDQQQLCAQVASYLASGKVVGWVQGRMEFGPRALGNRSILADPRNDDTQRKVNVKIKYRESFRPFAPSVMKEHAQEYFEMSSDSPYMLMVHPVQQARRMPEPDNYEQLSLKEKLYHRRSDLPAITHVDYSARIQTVSKETNPLYYDLINAFHRQTGCAVLVNTSFNVRGEPLVCTAEEAYRCFMRTDMDVLVVGNFVFLKELQPTWQETDRWKEEFVLD